MSVIPRRTSRRQSPMEIIEIAQDEWDIHTEGNIKLVLWHAETESGNPMINVYAKHVPSDRTTQLLSVIHSPGADYPATIQPDILYDDTKMLADAYVSETPAEFRRDLAKAFNLETIRNRVTDLAFGRDRDEARWHTSGIVDSVDVEGGLSHC